VQPVQISGEEICAIFFTSGTTGEPKPVPLTHDNFFYSAVGSALNLGITSRDNWLLCLPMDHMGGFSILMRSLIYGTAVTLLPSFSAESLVEGLTDRHITHISLVPTMLARLLQHEFSVPDSLRAILLGGGPADRDLVAEALQRNLPVLRTYGLTEACSQITTTPLDEIDAKLGSSGKPLVFSEVRIADEEGSEKPAGETGEIVIRGKTVTPGYPDDHAHKFEDGWFRTGDSGYMDHEGFLFTLSRKDDVIISGGENILPEEVESALLNNSRIEDVCVFGVPDSEWGEKIVAAIVLPESAAEFHPENILDAAQLARYKHPKDFIVLDAIPRTSLGKPKRSTLQKLYQKRSKNVNQKSQPK
jgi:O-succinylbenzoic acid--CoA ligase